MAKKVNKVALDTRTQRAAAGRAIILTNCFHGTQCKVRVSQEGTISGGQESKAKRELCGNQRCMCSGRAGARGGRYTVIFNGVEYVIVDAEHDCV